MHIKGISFVSNKNNKKYLKEIIKEKQHSNDFLQSILDSVPDAMITINSDAKIHSLNPAAEKMFGYQENEVLVQYLLN